MLFIYKCRGRVYDSIWLLFIIMYYRTVLHMDVVDGRE